MEATFTHPVPDDSLAVNTPLTCTELRRALASIKKVKVSTRVDTVSYRMLKEAPESVTAVKGKVVLTMYADDLAIWTDTHFRRLHTNSSWVKHSMKLFQEAVDGVVHFIQVNGFALSSQKTVFVPFHTNTSQNTEVHNQGERAEHLCIERSQVPGCTLHSLVAGTNQQVAHNARNASRALNVIKVVSAQPWANTPKIPVNVVRALVRSRLSYGLEAMPHLSKTGLARLTAIEVRGLRLALGLPQSVPQCLVYREAGLLPFRRHIQLVCSKYVFRCQTVDNSTVDEITATFRKPSRLQSYSSICDLVCDLVRSAGLDGVEVATRPMHPYPPWLLERAHVAVDMEGLMKDQNPLVLAVTARLCLEEKYQHHLKIFTDGSVMEDGAAGAAFVIPEFNNLTHSYTLACPPGNLPRLEGYYYPPVVGPVSPTDKAIYGQGYIHQTQRPL